MREHALPQDVVGYRFHIIGNMTLKQFAEVAIGCVIAFVIYSTNLPDLLKWPLVIMVAGAGAMLAFVPYEERPLDQWVTAFFMALYRPTQFYWTRLNKVPEPFLYESNNKHISMVTEIDLTPARRERVKEYLRSVDSPEQDEFEKNNSQRLNEVMNTFQEVLNTSLNTANVVYQAAPAYEPAYAPVYQEQAAAGPEVVINQPITQAANIPLNIPQDADAPQVSVQANVVPVAVEQPLFTQSVVTPTQNPRPVSAPSDSVVKRTTVSIPQMQNLHLEQTVKDDSFTIYQDTAQQPATFVDSASIQNAPQPVATQAVVQNKTLPFPEKPSEPNKVVGMVIDTQNNPIQNAIVEILTENGMSARAVKTNPFGQFFITTPLNNGNYTVVAEKEGLQFTPQQLSVTGQIINPIEVRSA